MQNRIQELSILFTTCLQVDKQALDLSDKFIKDDDIPIICEFITQKNQENWSITKLILSYNPISASGIAHFVEFNKFITHLDIVDGILDDKGFALLANNKTLTHINVTSNVITQLGAIEFAKNNTTIVEVNITNNVIGERGAKALVANDTIKHIIIAADDKWTGAVAKNALKVTDFFKKIQFGLETGMQMSFPSLVAISADKVARSMAICGIFAKQARLALTTDALDLVQNAEQKNIMKFKN